MRMVQTETTLTTALWRVEVKIFQNNPYPLNLTKKNNPVVSRPYGLLPLRVYAKASSKSTP